MKVGAQLYTLRAYIQNEKDMDAALKKVSEIGYTQVQISAIGPIAPEKTRELCDKYGLSIVLTHSNLDRIIGDTDTLIKEHDIMGCDYIGIGAMPEKYRNEDWISHFALDFKEAAKKIAAAGKLLMYHNHDFEFQKIGNRRLIDILIEDFTKEELGFTLDTYWVQAAGADPLMWMERLQDRIPCVHLKDMDMYMGKPVMAPVLEGNMNFEGMLKFLEKTGKTKHVLVEQDVCLESPFVCLKKSYDNLAKLGYR
ncbi:sugar phosphate isomerase/epimerase [Lachnospiraceae bacterium OttesenSCG-928-D06]|nr:sugar phosphate isomerase/epimerase [Lachnospiraceae bacterium OttesenSCG-928-D06]